MSIFTFFCLKANRNIRFQSVVRLEAWMIFVLQDPSGETAAKWESTGNLGIFVQQFALPPKCPLGKWMISTAENVGF